MRWKYGVYGKSIGNTKEAPACNAVAFATKEEAERGGSELLSRWFAPDGYVVFESDEPVTYRFVEGRERPVPKPDPMSDPETGRHEPVQPMSGDPALSVDLSDPDVGRLL